jgi:hypothetical protein
MPADAPTTFIKPRWKPLVITPHRFRGRKYASEIEIFNFSRDVRDSDFT